MQGSAFSRGENLVSSHSFKPLSHSESSKTNLFRPLSYSFALTKVAKTEKVANNRQLHCWRTFLRHAYIHMSSPISVLRANGPIGATSEVLEAIRLKLPWTESHMSDGRRPARHYPYQNRVSISLCFSFLYVAMNPRPPAIVCRTTSCVLVSCNSKPKHCV